MVDIKEFRRALSERERRAIAGLANPARIQAFLDRLAYSTDEAYRCPLRVLRERTAMCFDGALVGAALLRIIGHPPLILDMVPNNRDDDHVIALYKVDGYWGAIAKSNFVGLRFREPVYRTLRELVMSYFDQFYNLAAEKTMRAYTRPLNLKTLDRYDWMTSDAHLDRIVDRLDELQRIPVITKRQSSRLALVDRRSYEAGLHGAVRAGLFRPPKN
jgi:hypothetical protein